MFGITRASLMDYIGDRGREGIIDVACVKPQNN